MRIAYIDASALVKLIKPEPESDSLLAALRGLEALISSELIVVEALCTAKRLGDLDAVERAAHALDRIGLIPFDGRIRNRAAATRFEPPLRSLDAIHLATALSLRKDVDALLAYDHDMSAAARSLGFRVESPAT